MNLLTYFLIYTVIFFGVIPPEGFAQPDGDGKEASYRFVFYNVENFFDVRDDTLSAYDEYDPSGTRGWNRKKFETKRDNIYKAIAAVGGWDEPALVALAEVENRTVIEALIHDTPLNGSNYGIIHYDSKDERGIDVGAIFNKQKVEPVFSKPIPVRLPDPLDRTRDILYIKALVAGDTLHVFINHWPSRYGGILATEKARVAAAETLKQRVDSLCDIQKDAKVLVMGDFNDGPQKPSMEKLAQGCLQKISPHNTNPHVRGTYKYGNDWEYFDQVLISQGLLHGALCIESAEYQIFDMDFLLEDDERNLGRKPFRTYTGYKYHGGFSDHLPVYIDIYSINTQ